MLLARLTTCAEILRSAPSRSVLPDDETDTALVVPSSSVRENVVVSPLSVKVYARSPCLADSRFPAAS